LRIRGLLPLLTPRTSTMPDSTLCCPKIDDYCDRCDRQRARKAGLSGAQCTTAEQLCCVGAAVDEAAHDTITADHQILHRGAQVG